MTFMLLVLACLLSLCMLATLDIVSFSLGRAGWRRFISVFLLFYAQIIGTEFLLGTVSFLYGYSLALLNIIATATIVVMLHKKYGTKLFVRYLTNLKQIPGSLKEFAKQDVFLTVLYAICGLFLGWVLFLGLAFPPLDWDGNGYHLTYAADLVQNHNIYDAPTNLVWIPGYPKGGEFIQAWTILLSHNDTLVDLAQLPFAVAAIYALYAIARTVGISKKSAQYTSLLFILTPALLNQLTTAYVDIMHSTVFIMALALVLQKKYQKLDLLLIGITFSLLISIKASGMYMATFLVLPLIWNLYKEKGRSLKKYLLPVALVVSPMVFGLYWYIKNWVLYGSPIYPFGLRVAGKTLFHGIDFAQWSSGVGAVLPDNTFLRLWYTWSERTPNPPFVYNYDSSYFGFGIIWFIVLIPALLVSIYFAVKNRKHYFLVTLALLFGLLLVYPTDFSPRYTIFIISAGVLGLGLLFDYLHRSTIHITKVTLIILTIVTLGANFVLWSYRPNTVRSQLSSIFAGRGEHSSGTIYETNFGPGYLFMHNTIRSNQTVVYTAGNWIYPLWNNDFSNKVRYIDAPTKESWYREVIAQKADYIFTTTDYKIKENQWAMDKFKNVVYDNGWYAILKVH